MSQLNEHTEALLIKYLDGETSPAETCEVEILMNECEDCRSFMLQLRRIDETIEEQKIKQQINVDAALLSFLAHAGFEEKPAPKTKFIPLFLKIAAVFLVLLSIWFFYPKHDSELQHFAVVATNSICVDTLADGSIVTVNRNSSCKYTSAYALNNREIVLEGEAYFEVTPNKQKPFVVATSCVRVVVVGTKFNVTAMPQSNKVVVTVTEGIVEVQSIADTTKKITLRKGERGIYTQTTNTFKKEINFDKNFDAWKTRLLIFENTKLSDVVAVLHSVYGVKITFKDNYLSNCILTSEFENKSIEEIVHVIGAALEIDVQEINSGFVFSGVGC